MRLLDSHHSTLCLVGFPTYLLMFCSNLLWRHDGEISFSQYVEELKKDLCEAMVLAEKRASDEQKCQAYIYNRTVKGVEIEPGDRALLANKGERGHKKLADRWGDMVYTVVNRNPRTHTFEVRDPILGQSKVVRRNLLLCVNFLLPEADDSASPISSFASDENEAVDLSTEQFTQPDCAADHTTRTQHWISQIPMVGGNHLFEVLVPPAVTCVMNDDCEDMCVTGSSKAGGVPSNVPVSGDGLSYQSNPEHVGPNTSQTAASGLCPESVTTVRSRAGHIVRPVSRLIRTMNGQKLIS